MTTDAPCPRDDTCSLAAFADLDVNAWYHDGVHFCIEEGLMNGYDNGAFRPGADLSRAMLAQILYNRAGGVPVNYLMQYNDVPAGAWYAEAIRWAASSGVIEGYGKGRFGPDDPITREQLAVMLHRYAMYQGADVSVGEDTNILSYDDAFDISEWAIPAIQWACGSGVIEGVGSMIDPHGTATRAQAATMLQRFAELAE